MDNDLQQMLERRKRINRGLVPAPTANSTSDETKTYRAIQRSFNVFQEFPEFNMQKIKECENIFRQYDSDTKGFLTIEDCKKLMEFLKKPQTHLGLKKLINEATEGEQGKYQQTHPANTLSFYGFLSIYSAFEQQENLENMNHNNRNSIDDCSGPTTSIKDLARQNDIDVSTSGVNGAKNFFDAKIVQQNRAEQAANEIRAAQEQRKRNEEIVKQRKSDFKSRINMFDN